MPEFLSSPSSASASCSRLTWENRSPLRILVVCGGSYVSGAEIVALSVMEGLQERGHRIRCITNAWNDGDFPERLNEACIPHRQIPLGSVSKTLQPKYIWWTINALVHLPKAWFDYWREIRGFQPNLILFNSFVSASLLRPLINEHKAVFYTHELSAGSWHSQRCLEMEASFIAVSEYIKKCLIAEGTPAKDVSIVYNGITAPATRFTSNTVSPIKIGIAGQVGAWKGHNDLIKAMRMADVEEDSLQCHIVGRGDEDYILELKQKIEQYGLTKQVIWRGFQTDMEPIYQELDILVVPSRHEEPFGLVAVEAGMRELPVIATRRGGLPEIVVDGETGFLVDAESPEQIADRLRTLIDDPDLRERMGKAARRRVLSQFTRERMVDDMEEVLYEVARRPTS